MLADELRLANVRGMNLRSGWLKCDLPDLSHSRKVCSTAGYPILVLYAIIGPTVAEDRPAHGDLTSNLGMIPADLYWDCCASLQIQRRTRKS